MKECYAMQILKTKKANPKNKENKNNKEEWSQRIERRRTRTMKAKDDQGHKITQIT